MMTANGQYQKPVINERYIDIVQPKKIVIQTGTKKSIAEQAEEMFKKITRKGGRTI